MVERRTGERRSLMRCAPQNPVCMTIGFMFGLIIGSMIHTEHSMLNVAVSVVMATIVFHYTFVKNISFSQIFSKVIKKGS